MRFLLVFSTLIPIFIKYTFSNTFIKTEIEKYPFIVTIYCDNVKRGSGTILNKDFVFAAASILSKDGDYGIHFGSNYSGGGDSMGILVKVLHKNFDSDFRDNVGIVLLERELEFSPAVKPGRLPWKGKFDWGRDYVVLGFKPHVEKDNHLRFSMVRPIADMSKCKTEDPNMACVERDISRDVDPGALLIDESDMIVGLYHITYSTGGSEITCTWAYKDWANHRMEENKRKTTTSTTSTTTSSTSTSSSSSSTSTSSTSSASTSSSSPSSSSSSSFTSSTSPSTQNITESTTEISTENSSTTTDREETDITDDYDDRKDDERGIAISILPSYSTFCFIFLVVTPI